ncbi:MAG: alpha/beta hydrolase [Woeseiaceae bacterium]|nr:alpha/beta hydrolase [Woeseiaceae bacterium]
MQHRGRRVRCAAHGLLGYHTGAGVALEMARLRPQRVRRIVLVAVPMLTAAEREAGAALPPIPFDIDGEFARTEWQRSWRWRGPGQPVESVLATFAEKLRPGVRDRGASAILRYDLEAVLADTEHPLCIVRVRDDLWDATERAHRLRPDARYVELPDYGHGLFHAAPERMNEIARDCLDEA